MSSDGKGFWRPPVPNPIGTRFGAAGSHWASGHHTGLDFLAPAGTVVRAAYPGTVIYAGNTHGPYGIQVKVRHRAGLESWYCHLSSLSVRRGDQVSSGAQLGTSGATGNVTGPHLHFEVRVNGVAVDPAPWLGVGKGSNPVLGDGKPQQVDPGPSATFPDAGAAGSSSSATPAGFGLLPDLSDVRGLVLTGLFLAGGCALVVVGLAAAAQPAARKALGAIQDAGELALQVTPEGAAVGAATKGAGAAGAATTLAKG